MTTQTIPVSTEYIRTESKDLTYSKSKEKHAKNTKEEHAINTIETPNYNPKAFTTHRKHNHKTKPIYDYSIAESMLKSIDSTLCLDSLFDGNIVHLSFDCPVNLRSAFNAETKHNGTSICKELTHFMAQYVFSSLVKKHALGNTISKIAETNFTIESMNFTQNVQSRPRRLLRSVEVEGAVASEVCMIGDCRRPAVDLMVYSRKGEESVERMVCAFHSSEFAKCKEWSFKR
jgi:hypothetical protein